MKALLVCVLLCAPLARFDAAEPAPQKHELRIADGISAEEQARRRKARNKLDEIKLPEVSLSKVSMREALDWVTQATSKALSKNGPVGFRGVNMVNRFRDADERITLEMRSATYPEVLDAICAQHDYVWGVEPTAVFIVPREKAPSSR